MLREQHLAFLDRITGERAASWDLINGRWPVHAGIQLAQAGAGTLNLPGGGSVPWPEKLSGGRLKIGAGIFTAAMLLNEISSTNERRQVDDAIRRFRLDRNNAVDILAARAYVWGRNIAPFQYWSVPFSGPLNERVAIAIMRHERDNPGTLGLASRGQRDAKAAIDAIVKSVVGGASGIAAAQVFKRTSEIDPALSTDSTKARAILSIQNRSSWRAHHLIPFAVMAAQPPRFQRAVVAAGWRMDSIENLVALPANLPTYVGLPNRAVWPYHFGSHPIYSSVVTRRLSSIAGRARPPTGQPLRTELAAIESLMKDYLVTNRTKDVHPRAVSTRFESMGIPFAGSL
jgi:hypothetical protein